MVFLVLRLLEDISKQPMNLLHTVVSSYEVQDIIDLMKDVDPDLIVNVIKTENFLWWFLSTTNRIKTYFLYIQNRKNIFTTANNKSVIFLLFLKRLFVIF